MFSGLDTTQTHSGRRWTATASFTVQIALVAAALVIPLLRPESLPDAFAHRQIFRPISMGDPHVAPSDHPSTPHPSVMPVSPILVNRGPAIHFTDTHAGTPETNLPPGPDVTFGDRSGTANTIISDFGRVIPTPPPVVQHPVGRQSVMMEGNLLHRIEPRYPPLAQQLGIQGTVIIKAVISREGNIEHEEVVSGQPLLTVAALAAVREWKYRPYVLNGEPIEVETQITVNFILHH